MPADKATLSRTTSPKILLNGLRRVFIPCLVLNQTKALFSLAMLSFISAIVLQVTLRAATALWATNFVNGLLHTSSEGLTTQSLEGGIGLLMTVLIISVPPMAGNFFQGTLDSFMYFSAFGGGAGNRPGPQGQPPGSYGHGASPPSSNTAQTHPLNQPSSGFNPPNLGRMADQASTAQADVTKTGNRPT